MLCDVRSLALVALVATPSLAQPNDYGSPPPAAGQEATENQPTAEGSPAAGVPGAESPPQGRPANCPPGAWCDEEFKEAPPPAAQAPASEPGADAAPVVVADPSAPPRIRVDRGPRPPPPKPRHRWRRWGIDVRLSSVLMGDRHGKHPDAQLGGIGVEFRYRPGRRAAFSLGLDAVGGTDFNGYERGEGILSPGAIIYLNPRDRAQVYTLIGLHFAGADVEVPAADGGTNKRDYSYFGGQFGLGLEFRLARWFSLDAALVGFVRGRTDDLARSEPEFIDADTGRATNDSGGGLFRFGGVFYW